MKNMETHYTKLIGIALCAAVFVTATVTASSADAQRRRVRRVRSQHAVAQTTQPAQPAQVAGPAHTNARDQIAPGAAVALPGGLFVRLGDTPAEVTLLQSTCGGARTETCNNAIDDDCDGQIDEACPIAHTNSQGQPPTPVGTGAVQITLAWNSESDMGMTVIEPDNGELPDTEGRVSDNGGEYQIAVNSACTDQQATKVENVRYARMPRLGRYIVRPQLQFLCSAPRARATMSISVGGRVIAAYQFVLDERNETREFSFLLDDQ